MLLQDYFADQLHQLRTFFDEPDCGAKLLAVDEQLISIVEKTLIKLDGLDDNPHVLHPTTTAFDDVTSYAIAVLNELFSDNEEQREALSKVGVEIPVPGEGDPITRLADYVQRFSDSWPPSEGHYIVILHPESVAVPEQFLDLAAALAGKTTPPIVKWIFFVDSDVVPDDFPDDHPILHLQRWEASSQEVQQEVVDQLESDELPPPDRLRLTSMAAGFAAGEGDMESTQLLHQETIRLSREQGDVPSEATAHYHLGNALLAEQQFDLAEGHLSQSAVLAVDCEMHSLVGMAMTHLGVCLHALERDDEAVAAFDAAAATFDGLGDLPAHARVYDVRALHALSKGDKEQAKIHWSHALSIFESIEPGPLDPVRDAGIEEFQEKLRQHCGGPDVEGAGP
ncbi:hypothetical protein CKO51_00130 [Rhodopirellula sp. SM50]|nr:hypothetical protein [Rhodopirellula sp. SM50]PAY21516.1 hypothetical protein CKO51_00130 [Rhodopirellula sp. SM50]